MLNPCATDKAVPTTDCMDNDNAWNQELTCNWSDPKQADSKSLWDQQNGYKTDFAWNDNYRN